MRKTVRSSMGLCDVFAPSEVARDVRGRRILSRVALLQEAYHARFILHFKQVINHLCKGEKNSGVALFLEEC